MIRLNRSAMARGNPAFRTVLKIELETLDSGALPLQEGLSNGGYVTGQQRQVMIISVSDEGDSIRAKAGIFYAAILTGCACADDPTPVNEESEYCEVQLVIDKLTGETMVSLLER